MKRRASTRDDLHPVISIDDNENESVSGEGGVRAPIAPIEDTLCQQSFRQAYGRQRATDKDTVFEQFHDFQKLSGKLPKIRC